MRAFKPILYILAALSGFEMSPQSGAALAEPLNAETFDQYTQGKTLYFSSKGEPYGAEIYLRNRRVRWSFLDGSCREGYWFPQDQHICFLYEGSDLPQCWQFDLDQAGLRALFLGQDGNTELVETTPAKEDLICPGPRFGV